MATPLDRLDGARTVRPDRFRPVDRPRLRRVRELYGSVEKPDQEMRTVATREALGELF